MAIRIATYNTQDLFLHGEGVQKKPRALRALRHMIKQVGADLWVLQEVGSLASLQTLNAGLAEPFAHAYLLPGNSNRSIHIGVLSHTALDITSHRERVLTDAQGEPLIGYADQAAALAVQPSPVRVQRDVLRLDMQLKGQALSVFAVHLKSHAQMNWQVVDNLAVRTAEVRLLAALMAEQRARCPDAWLIAAGDFNDDPSSSAFMPLEDLSLVDLHGARYAAMGRRPSTFWRKRRARIDRILVCANTAQHAVADSALIHNGHQAQVASDHYSVSLDLALEV